MHASTEKVLILGTGPQARMIAEAIKATPRLQCSVVGPAEEFERIVRQWQPNRIIVALAELDGSLPVSNLLNLHVAGIVVEDAVEVYERFTRKLPIEVLPPGFFISSREFRKSKLQTSLQRAASLAFAALGLVLAAPLMVTIALAVKLDSIGPVLFIQERVGFRGQIFRLPKFRTMLHLPPAGEPESVWSRDNSRVTRVGKWLRKFHLDELPQLISILKGDMNLIGPRPEMAGNIKTMAEIIPYYHLRHTVRPGLTGWAQVRTGYALSQEEVTEKIRHDLYYVKNMSLRLDLRILIETVKILLFGFQTAS